MIKVNLKEVHESNLRQIEKELKFYCNKGNQVMVFELLDDKRRITEQIKKLN